MNRSTRQGFAATIAAHVIWGLLPIYWKPLTVMDPVHLIAWRMLGFTPLVWLIHISGKGLGGIRLPGWRNSLKISICSLLIVGNWATFIWGINLNMTVEISLGYYISPLVTVLLGMLFFREHLAGMRKVALLLALTALVLMTLDAGKLPLVSILLGLFFSFYGLTVKKLPDNIGNIESLAWQSLFMAPIGLLALAFTDGYPSIIQKDGLRQILLIGSGVATLLPLWLFIIGARRLPLGVIGFLQYIGPSLILVLGVLRFGENFGGWRILSFALVFVALVLYSLSMNRDRKKNA